MKKAFILILTFVTVGIAVWFLSKPIKSGGAASGDDQPRRSEATNSASPSDFVVGSNKESGSVLKSPEEQAKARIMDVMKGLNQGELEAGEARRLLKELREFLGTLPPEMAAAVMAEFLSNQTLDSPTGLEFTVGANGFLDDPSSLRVALLDWLLQFDLKTAGVVAAQVLSSPTQSDEWAVSLRNFARANPTSGSFDFLRTKTEELIRNPEWRDKPSVGYFEAFDVLVYTKAKESAPLLSELVSDTSPEGRPYAHASYLTLDRLVINQPVEMMKELSGRNDLMAARGKMVANMFARADLREPDQQQLVREYLLNPNRTNDELAAFSGVYPNNNYAISKNLLTGNDSRTNEQLISHDRAALEIVTSWLGDPAFDSVKPHVETMHKRLETFVGQAAK
jgi:hypothetical protein